MKLLAFLLSTVAVTLAAPALETRQFEDIIFPAGTYRRWVQSGKIVQDPQDQLLIVKNGKAADETTTIVTFDFDQSTEGKTCELIFELWDRDVSTGTQTLDVFTWSDPPSGLRTFSVADIAEWAEAKSRDNHVGRILAPKPGNATWIMAYQGWPKIPCPTGQLIGIEYVGVGDRVEVRWDIGVTGPRFRVL
ncbi:hypothetical protein NW754_005800 [Fusarium falciforme]|uniref:Ubiquitin 3 binding protein But2 C-terminal domain-containing protein n=1 Tax=Fusarium falciforme TaxID=195108 RepID=A0A9W8QYT5_9HYPO|nr:hypothetical protein NW754_005800 [Fusarium falciforme]KAJ4180211.1 hypothetical protein NW755_011899 [Fusarium falciforme]KAJ4240348.1 hypothetical protein NW757_012526 [Fusarium falciforme]